MNNESAQSREALVCSDIPSCYLSSWLRIAFVGEVKLLRESQTVDAIRGWLWLRARAYVCQDFEKAVLEGAMSFASNGCRRIDR